MSMAGDKAVCFCYDHEHDTWKETMEPDFTKGDIPLVIIVKFFHEFHGLRWEKVWCPEQQSYEEITGYTENGVATAAGCELKGWQVRVEHNIYQNWHNHREASEVAFCWCLYKYHPDENFCIRRYTADVAFSVARFFLSEKEP